MISVKEMLEIERKTVENGIPISALMENAGIVISEIVKKNAESGKALIVCYHGNNGGDGFAAAKYLDNADILLLGDKDKLGPEARDCYEKVRKKIIKQADYHDYELIVDAMLGTGTKGNIKEPLSSAIDSINSSKAIVISVDVPTGMDPDTGEVLDKAVNPNLVICFYDIKKGLESIKDKCIIFDIGFKP